MEAREKRSRRRRRSGKGGGSSKTLFRAIRYIGNYRRVAIIAYAALLVATLAQLAVPQLAQSMIDAIILAATLAKKQNYEKGS